MDKKMKNILKKTIRFFKRRPVYTYLGVGLLITLFVPKYFMPIWLANWIFYFYFYAVISFIGLVELGKPLYFLYKKDKKNYVKTFLQ